MPAVYAPCHTSSGENAWMWRSGNSALIASTSSMYQSPVKPGWMPPWRHTSVPPRAHASWQRRMISSRPSR